MEGRADSVQFHTFSFKLLSCGFQRRYQAHFVRAKLSMVDLKIQVPFIDQAQNIRFEKYRLLTNC